MIILGLTGCADSDSQLYVSTASSLIGPFEELEAAFEASNPGVDVILNVGGSSTLAHQIEEGAPIDVFAAADMSFADGAKAIPFATNRLQIIVPAGNPGGVQGIESLGEQTLLVAACAVTLPCGHLAEEVLAEAGLTVDFDSREPNVKAVLEKVSLGELDAGLVYVTDASPDVESIAIDSALANRYPIVVVSGHPLAGEFVELVTSSAGLAILAGWGFGPP